MSTCKWFRKKNVYITIGKCGDGIQKFLILSLQLFWQFKILWKYKALSNPLKEEKDLRVHGIQQVWAQAVLAPRRVCEFSNSHKLYFGGKRQSGERHSGNENHIGMSQILDSELLFCTVDQQGCPFNWGWVVSQTVQALPSLTSCGNKELLQISVPSLVLGLTSEISHLPGVGQFWRTDVKVVTLCFLLNKACKSSN